MLATAMASELTGTAERHLHLLVCMHFYVVQVSIQNKEAVKRDALKSQDPVT